LDDTGGHTPAARIDRRRLLIAGTAAAGAAWTAPTLLSAPAHAQGSALVWVLRITDGGCAFDVGFPYCRRPSPTAVVYIDANQEIALQVDYYLADGSLLRTECTTAGPSRGMFAVGFYVCASVVRPNPTIPAGFRTVVSRMTACPGGTVLEQVESVSVGCTTPFRGGSDEPATGAEDPDTMPEILLP